MLRCTCFVSCLGWIGRLWRRACGVSISFKISSIQGLQGLQVGSGGVYLPLDLTFADHTLIIIHAVVFMLRFDESEGEVDHVTNGAWDIT